MYFSIYSSNSTNTDFSGLGNVYLSQWFSVILDVQHTSNKLKMLRRHFPDLKVFHQKEFYLKANVFSNFQKGCRKSYKHTYEVNGFMLQHDIFYWSFPYKRLFFKLVSEELLPKKSTISAAWRSSRGFCYLFCSILITFFLDYIFSIKIYIYTESMKMNIFVCFPRQRSSLNIISFFPEL